MKLIPTSHNIGANKKHPARVLNEPGYDVVQIHLDQDEEMTTHHAKVETLIIVRTGKVSFTVEEETVILTN
jgi:quercetin dioxygenase-like cupin family protein